MKLLLKLAVIFTLGVVSTVSQAVDIPDPEPVAKKYYELRKSRNFDSVKEMLFLGHTEISQAKTLPVVKADIEQMGVTRPDFTKLIEVKHNNQWAYIIFKTEKTVKTKHETFNNKSIKDELMWFNGKEWLVVPQISRYDLFTKVEKDKSMLELHDWLTKNRKELRLKHCMN